MTSWRTRRPAWSSRSRSAGAMPPRAPSAPGARATLSLDPPCNAPVSLGDDIVPPIASREEGTSLGRYRWRPDADRPVTGVPEPCPCVETRMRLTRLPRAAAPILFPLLALLVLIMPEFVSASEIVSPPPSQIETWRARVLDQRLHGKGPVIDLSEDPQPIEAAPTQNVDATSSASWSEVPPPALWLHS